jgi:serine/threonine-protein kinase haspin
MPPKVVYGKKKTTTQTTTSFSKLLSSEKDGVAPQRDVKKNSWRHQLEDAAQQNPGEVDLAALEKGLGGLKLEQTQTGEDVVVTKKPGRPRKAARNPNATETKENYRPRDDVPEIEARATAEGGQMKPSQLEVVVQTQKGGRRKALEDRSANAKAVVDCHILEARSKKDKKCRADDAALSSPARTREPGSKTPKPSTPSRTPQLPTPEPTPEPDDLYSAYASPLLSLSYGKKIVSFEHWSSELEPHFEITKIAEASFSEVYRLSALHSTAAANQESVLKVVALKTPPNAPLPFELHARAFRDHEAQTAKEMAERAENDVWKSEVADVLSEVKLLQNLNHIPGFTNFRDLTILQGRPSPAFSNAWNKSRPRGKKSEFPDPSKKTSYDDTQLWAIIEMQDAGTDCEKIMENGGLSSIWEVWDVFWGVCLSVAKAEEVCKFEHRDLHMGNICVRSTRAGNDVTEVTVKDPLRRKFRFTGLETTVIDYTLSRADILPSPSRRSSSASIGTAASLSPNSGTTEMDIAWLDLNKDSALFEGDASEEYQYEIYRYMRGAALYHNPLQNAPAVVVPLTPRRSPRKNTHIRFDEDDSQCQSPHKPTLPNLTEEAQENIWKQFHPRTNLVWAHFLLHKLLTHLDNSANTPDQLSTKQIMSNVEADEANTEPLKIKKKALKLYSVLSKVSELLCPVALGRQESLGSVKELVVLALEERWLRVGDVAA